MAGLIEDGWSLVIYPEGGRSPDGWGQTFKGGAAYLAGRTGAPVVPVYIDGTDSIMGKGTQRPQAGPHPGDVRQPAAPPTRGVDAAVQRAHRARPSPPSPTSRRPTTGRPGAAPRPERPRRSPARRTRAGGGGGISPLVAGGASPAGATRRSGAGPTSADRRSASLVLVAARHEDVGTDDEGAVARCVGVGFVELVDGDVELSATGRDVARLDRVGALPRAVGASCGSSGSWVSSALLVRRPSACPRPRRRRSPRPPRRPDRAPALLAGC